LTQPPQWPLDLIEKLAASTGKINSIVTFVSVKLGYETDSML